MRIFKVVLAICIIIGVGYLLLVTAGVALIIKTASDHTDLYGEIKVYADRPVVSQPFAMELIPPEELDGIHRPMWDVVIKGESKSDFENTFEAEEIPERFSSQEIQEIFGKPVDDFEFYVVYIPHRTGKINVEVFGFYKQTNPQYISETEVMVYEKE